MFQPALGWAQHPKSGQNTQHPRSKRLGKTSLIVHCTLSVEKIKFCFSKILKIMSKICGKRLVDLRERQRKRERERSKINRMTLCKCRIKRRNLNIFVKLGQGPSAASRMMKL